MDIVALPSVRHRDLVSRHRIVVEHARPDNTVIELDFQVLCRVSYDLRSARGQTEN